MGDKVRIHRDRPTAANPRYRDAVGVGVVINVTPKRVIVRWSGRASFGVHGRERLEHWDGMQDETPGITTGQIPPRV